MVTRKSKVRVEKAKGYKRQRVIAMSVRVDALRKLPDRFVADVTFSNIKKRKG